MGESRPMEQKVCYTMGQYVLIHELHILFLTDVLWPVITTKPWVSLAAQSKMR